MDKLKSKIHFPKNQLLDCYDYFPCKVGFFQCKYDAYCIQVDQVCDGINHCSEGEDEIDCGTFSYLSFLVLVVSFFSFPLRYFQSSWFFQMHRNEYVYQSNSNL